MKQDPVFVLGNLIKEEIKWYVISLSTEGRNGHFLSDCKVCSLKQVKQLNSLITLSRLSMTQNNLS